MKIIGRDKFGLLYDKLYEYLERTDGNILGVGIERGATNEILTQLWKLGETWETITLIIAYHYSRTETLMLKISDTSTMILRGASFKEIQKLLGIKIDKEEISRCVIPEEDFREEYKKVEELFRGITTKKQLSALLNGLGITSNNRSLLVGYWKGGRLWEVIVAIIILLRAGTFDDIIVQTGKGEIRYKGGKQDCYLVLEEIENVLLAG